MGERTGWRGQNESQIIEEKKNGRLIRQKNGRRKMAELSHFKTRLLRRKMQEFKKILGK